MSEHRYGIRILEGRVDPNPLMVERQDPDSFTRFQTRERCALEIAAYVFNMKDSHFKLVNTNREANSVGHDQLASKKPADQNLHCQNRYIRV